MHTSRVVHRDIKPANVLLFEGGLAKLGDLSLSRYFSKKTYECFSVVGSPYYMSPEAIHSETGYSYKSDLWSLGCLLYELATLRFFPLLLASILANSHYTECERKNE